LEGGTNSKHPNEISQTQKAQPSEKTAGTEKPNAANGPLTGLKVLDIATVYAAPFATALLGDYGADVIKIELPGKGDPVRGFHPFKDNESLAWAAISRNKRAITLNLKKEKGQHLFYQLLKNQDLLFENFRPGTLDQWGVTVQKMREVNPRLIIIRVSGYGQTGPYRTKAGFGTPATAFSGYTYISGYPDKPPLSPPISLVDYVTGLFAVIGALSALYHRDAKGGAGQEIDVSLFESMFRLLEVAVATYDQTNHITERLGNDNTSAVPVGTFQTRDGKWMVLTTSTDRTFYRLADVMGRSDMKTDPRYATNIERVKRRTEVHAIVQEWFKAHDAGEIQEIFDKNGIPVSPIYNMADIFQDPQYKARGALVEVDHPVLGKIKLPNVIPKFSQTPGTVRKTGASIGEHNFEIFTELGLSLEDINELKEEGVI